MAQAFGAERRANRRYRYVAQASVARNQGESETGRLVDVSSGGCLVELTGDHGMDAADAVELTLRSNFLSLRANGAVQRSTEDGRQLAIRFIEISQRGRADLSELIASLEHMRVAERDRRSGPGGRPPGSR